MVKRHQEKVKKRFVESVVDSKGLENKKLNKSSEKL